MKRTQNMITCRVCLENESNKSPKFLFLFENYNDNYVADKINSITNVEIKPGDGLPDRICPNCLIQLENALAFKSQCETSNVILRKKTQNGSKSQIEVQVKDENATEYDWLEYNLPDIKVKSELTEDLNQVKEYDLVECHDCGGTFKSKCKLRIHWRITHQPEELTCPNCKRIFKSYRAFNLHARIKPKSCITASMCRIEGKGRSRVFHCTDCHYKTNNPRVMIFHKAIHTGERRYQCDKCTKSYTQMSSLQSHQESAHDMCIKVTTCQYCGKNIKSRKSLYKHLKQHTDCSVQCEICKKLFRGKQSLQVHMARHSGVKAFSCEKCGRTFYTMSELCNHRRLVHEKTKSFKCDICGYVMRTSVRLKIHKSKHTNTNVPCLICGMFVENAQMLVVHQKRHLERNTLCPHCDKTFHNKKSLAKHIRAKHRCTMLVNKVNRQTEKPKTSSIKQERPVLSQIDASVDDG